VIHEVLGRGTLVHAESGVAVQYDSGWTAEYPGHSVGSSGHKRLLDRLDFGAALEQLKAGQRVTRAGWNKGTWLALVEPDANDVSSFGASPWILAPWVAMKTADDKVVPWSVSQADVLADDWEVVE
jgi:hypothetical protein